MSIIYTTIGTVEEVFPEDKQSFSLKEIQSFVGGYVERISNSNSTDIVLVNEEARIKKLPFNVNASSSLGINLFGNVFVCEDEHLK